MAIVPKNASHVGTKNCVDTYKAEHDVRPKVEIFLALSRLQRVVEKLYTHHTQEKRNHVEVRVHEDETLYNIESEHTDVRLRLKLSIIVRVHPSHIVIEQNQFLDWFDFVDFICDITTIFANQFTTRIY